MPNRVVFAKNPVSSRAAHGEKLISRMRQSAGDRPYATFTTQSADVWKNIEALANVVQDDDVVVSVGGDGMAFTVGNALLLAGRAGTSMTVLPAGGGNDTSRATVKRPKHAPYIFETGAPRPIHPMQLRVHKAGNVILDCSALNYASAGVSGEVSQRLNNGLPRQLRNLSPGVAGKIVRKTVDAAVALDSLFIGPTPPCIYDRGDRMLTTSELMYINGASLAGTLRTGQSFERPELTRVELPYKYLKRAAAIGSVMTRNLLSLPIAGEIIKDDEVTFMGTHIIEFDGEDMQVPAGTTMQVSSSQQSLAVWTNLPSLTV